MNCCRIFIRLPPELAEVKRDHPSPIRAQEGTKSQDPMASHLLFVVCSRGASDKLTSNSP